MIEHLSMLIAGLGLYFFGVSGLRQSLQQIPGRKFRDFIGKATAHPALSAVSGFFMGTITQTSIGCTVILAGLISRGMATLYQALPMVAWTNLGLVTLVLLNELPLPTLAMVLVGIGGVCLNFGLGGRFKGAISPLFSLGLILFALMSIKESTGLIAMEPGVMESLALLPESFKSFCALMLGVLLRIPIQSSSAVALLGIILEDAKIFTTTQALLMLIGTSFGTGASIFLLTAHFKGLMRQITLFEAIINAAAGGVMMLLFAIEYFFDVPLLVHGLAKLDSHVDQQLAIAFLIQQSLCVVFGYLLLPRASAWLEQMAPTTVEQDISRPRFIHDEAVQDSETALTLTEQELGLLLGRTPAYLNEFRSEPPAEPSPAPIVLHNAAVSLFGEISSLLEAVSANPRQNSSVRLLKIQRRVNLLMETEDAIFRLVTALESLSDAAHNNPTVNSLTHNIVESLDLLLNTSICALSSNREDANTLLELTSNPGEVIEGIRNQYLHNASHLGHSTRKIILSITTQYERVVIYLNQLSRNILATPL